MDKVKKAVEKLDSAYEDLMLATELMYEDALGVKRQNKELEGVLKSIVNNDGKMTPVQIDAVVNYYGWEPNDV